MQDGKKEKRRSSPQILNDKYLIFECDPNLTTSDRNLTEILFVMRGQSHNATICVLMEPRVGFNFPPFFPFLEYSSPSLSLALFLPRSLIFMLQEER